jgi:A/G-specific adenine glycosylase
LRSIEITESLAQQIESRKRQIQKRILKWARTNLRTFPWRHEVSPYRVLVAEVLLKRTTSTQVEKSFQKFIEKYPNINTLARARDTDLRKILTPLGYYKKRAQIFIEIANYIAKEHHGEIPKTKEELLKIPQIGDYTANAILSLAYDIPSAMVDCNIIRIETRVFLKHLPQKHSQKTIQKVADLLSPVKDNQCHNYALLDLGALVCRSGIPRCKECPIKEFCDYYSLGKPHAE